MVRCKAFCYTLLSYLIIIFISNSYAAETGKIAGRITDKATGEPIVGASIFVDAMWVNGEQIKLAIPQGAASDADGQYFILNLRPGEYTVQCRFIGYSTIEITNVKVAVDRTTRLDFELSVELIESKEIVVSAFKPNKVEKDLTATKQTYTLADVENFAGINELSDILDLQADVIDNHFRGGREGESLNLIGGANINNPLNSSRSFEPMVIALQEVEVLTSGFSAEYGNAQSGVINMIPKEGTEKWNTRLEYEFDLPNDRIWGGNPYAIENMPFYSKLSRPEEWLTYYYADGNKKYIIQDWDVFMPPTTHYSNISDINVRNARIYTDSLRAGTMAMVNWLQMGRLVGLQNNDIPLTRFNLTTGGPLSEKVKIFIAASQLKESPIVTVTDPDLTRQIMSNITAQPSKDDKLSLYYHYNYSFRNSTGTPTNWLDLSINDSKIVKTDQLVGLRWNHVFNQASFMDAALRMLDTKEEENPVFLDPGRYVSDGFNGNSTNNTYAGRYDNTPSGHRANNLDYNRGYTKTKTISFDGSYTYQINNYNLLKSGLQLQYYGLDVDELYHLTSPGENSYSKYKVHPYEGALYLQDKMEFEGFIANAGLRYNFYDFNYEYYSNLFTPLLNPKYPAEGKARDSNYALKERTKFFGRIEPRLGISFPVSENTVFHLNYGTFLQRPAFNYVLNSEMTSRGEISEIGNARLKPEKTSAWDIGIVHSLPWDFRIDVSAYYKDVNDLVQEAVYVNSSNEAYINYTNRDYANIKGFNINLERTRGALNFYLKYNYQKATGKASEPGGALVTIYETPLSDGTTIDLPDPRDVLMDYDRTHRLIANIGFQSGHNDGPELFGILPFADLAVSATFKYQSGRPYTDDDQLLGLVLNKRMPDFYDLKIRIQKAVSIANFRTVIYLEGFNVLNQKEWSRKIFTDKETLKRWKNGDRDNLIWYDGTYEEDPNEARWIYQYSDAYSVYQNEPRYFRFGVRVQF